MSKTLTMLRKTLNNYDFAHIPYHPNKNLSKEQLKTNYGDLSKYMCQLNNLKLSTDSYKKELNEQWTPNTLENDNLKEDILNFERELTHVQNLLCNYKAGLANEYRNRKS